jgi:hypothetical protein
VKSFQLPANFFGQLFPSAQQPPVKIGYKAKHRLFVFCVFVIESIPEEFQEAVKSKQAVVGMDRNPVLASLERPLKKVRGQKGEDWLDGEGPHKVVFVTFLIGRSSA